MGFNTRKSEASHFVVVQHCLGYSRSLVFPYELPDQLSISARKVGGILIGITLNLWINFGSIAILIILSLLIHEHDAFPFIQVFFLSACLVIFIVQVLNFFLFVFFSFPATLY